MRHLAHLKMAGSRRDEPSAALLFLCTIGEYILSATSTSPTLWHLPLVNYLANCPSPAMIASPLFLIVLTFLLPARSSSQAAAKCPNSKVQWADCQKAYGKIIYEQDTTLPRDELHVERASGTCVVIVEKKRETVIRKKDIEAGFNKMHDTCKESAPFPVPGIAGAVLKVRARGSLPFTIEDDAPFGKPVCLDPPRSAKAIKKPQDCAAAFDALPTATDGRFSDDGKRGINIVMKNVNTCFATVLTSDDSEIVATKKDVQDAFKRMLDACGSKWAGISLQKGARGKNGRLIITATPPA